MDKSPNISPEPCSHNSPPIKHLMRTTNLILLTIFLWLVLVFTCFNHNFLPNHIIIIYNNIFSLQTIWYMIRIINKYVDFICITIINRVRRVIHIIINTIKFKLPITINNNYIILKGIHNCIYHGLFHLFIWDKRLHFWPRRCVFVILFKPFRRVIRC